MLDSMQMCLNASSAFMSSTMTVMPPPLGPRTPRYACRQGPNASVEDSGTLTSGWTTATEFMDVHDVPTASSTTAYPQMGTAELEDQVQGARHRRPAAKPD